MTAYKNFELSKKLEIKSLELTEWSQELPYTQVHSDINDLNGLQFNCVRDAKDYLSHFFSQHPSVYTSGTKVISLAVKKDGKTYTTRSFFLCPTIINEEGVIKFYNF